MTTTETPSSLLPAPGAYAIDASHSSVTFSARHLMVSKVRGRFAVTGGAIVVSDQPEQSSVEATIDAASVQSGDPKRDEHLRSSDFFDTDQHRFAQFRSAEVDDHGDGTFTLHGDLTIRGITRPVTLEGEYLGTQASPWNDTRVGFSAETEVNRKDWGLTWNVALETGGVVVGDKVKLVIDAEWIKA